MANNSSIDPELEYDAPRYIDFQLLQEGHLEDDDVDTWFDHRATFSDSFVPGDLAAGSLLSSGVKEEPEVVTEDLPSHTDQLTGSDRVRRMMDIFHAGLEENKREKGRQGKKASRDTNIKSVQPPEKVPKRAHREAAQKATVSIHSLLSHPRSPKAHPLSAEPTMPHITDGPKVSEAKQKQAHLKIKTTEELQMEEMQRLRKEAKRRLRQSRKSFRKLAKSSGPIAVKYSKKTTETLEFRFKTAGRERMKVSGQHPAVVHPTQFAMTLRSSSKAENFHPNVPSTKPPTPDGVTKIKPFKFHLDSRLSSKSTASSIAGSSKDLYMPMAEAIQKFQKATPPRFHSKKPSTAGGGIKKSVTNTELTMPKTPNLVSRSRSRPITVKSTDEMEEEAVAEMKSYQFKANPLNPEILRKAGLFGVPRKCANVPLTTPMSPKLTTVERFQKRKPQEEPKEEAYEFHANPLPKDILQGVKGVPQKRLRPATCPESPAIAKKKLRLEENQDEEEQVSHVIHANPMPEFDQVFRPELPRRAIDTQPFNFEERYRDKPTRETLVQQILQKEKKPEFKAQPLPEFTMGPLLPPKSVQQPTKVKPFNLQTEMRGHQHSTKWIQKVEEDSRKAKLEAEFKAKEPSVLYSRPFVALKSSKPLTDVNSFVLHSEVRHEQRAMYEAEKQQREQMREQENTERQALQAAEEAKMMSGYRKTLVHKAQPVLQRAPINIKASNKPVTVPKAPVFHSDSRLRGLPADL